MYKAGFVSIIGKPNAGKSTLLNALLGQKLSIITPKAQTTRHRILGIDTTDTYQIVYSDTPGIIRPKYKLHEKMMESVGDSLQDADVIVLVIAIEERYSEEEVKQLLSKTNIPKILVVNKIDTATPQDIAIRKLGWEQMTQFDCIVETSAIKAENIELLKEKIISFLPENPPYYDSESISDRPERFFAAELIREQIFMCMSDEIPYSSEVSIIQFEEKTGLTKIHAEIYVERQSQKGMIIGKNGSMLKRIGSKARKNIEEFLDAKVFLELHVKVREGWKENNQQLKNLGYD
jgi:GTP-binding protein Era